MKQIVLGVFLVLMSFSVFATEEDRAEFRYVGATLCQLDDASFSVRVRGNLILSPEARERFSEELAFICDQLKDAIGEDYERVEPEPYGFANNPRARQALGLEENEVAHHHPRSRRRD